MPLIKKLNEGRKAKQERGGVEVARQITEEEKQKHFRGREFVRETAD